MNRFALVVLASIFAIQFFIVVLFYLWGWKAAVSLFPLLLLMGRLSRHLNKKPRKTKSQSPIVEALLWIGVFAIPAIAVIASKAEWMRLWVLPVGALLLVVSVQSRVDASNQGIKKTRDQMSVPVLSAVLFAAGSEAVWHFGGLGAWIWYHAFFLQIFFALFALVVKFINPEWINSGSDTIIECKPPAARSKHVGERHSVFIKINDRTWEHYKDITLGQAQALLQATFSSHDKNVETSPRSVLYVEFGGSTSMRFVPDNAHQGLIELYQAGAVGRRILQIPYRLIRARSVPLTRASELLVLGWEEHWEALELSLKPFAE